MTRIAACIGTSAALCLGVCVPAAGASATGGTSPAAAPSPGATRDLGSAPAVRMLRPGMHGAAVRGLQRALAAAGFSVSVDGAFGPGTARALRSFQRARRLRATGRVDARTAQALAGVKPVTNGPAPALSGAGLRARIVSSAESQVGVGETPPGSNCTKYGPCEKWCGDFATWVWRQAGVPAIGRISWVPDLVAWGKQHGSWKPGADNDPQPGDMVIFSGIHVGLVERVSSGGQLTIIAGNTSGDNVAQRGPAAPADASSLGPAAISGYVSPVTVPGNVNAARAASRTLPRPTAAQKTAQDPWDN